MPTRLGWEFSMRVWYDRYAVQSREGEGERENIVNTFYNNNCAPFCSESFVWSTRNISKAVLWML